MYPSQIDFPFYRFLFECTVSGPLLYFTPRRGETIKGLIAQEAKKIFPCDTKLSCRNCHIQSCDYVRFFRADLTGSNFSYCIIPPLRPRSVYYKGEKFYFEIRLFGDCANFNYLLKYFAPAVEQGGLFRGMGNWYLDHQQFGRFRLNNIYAWQPDNWEQIFSSDKGFLINDIKPLSFGETYNRHLGEYTNISFYTPCRLVRDKKIVSQPVFEDIVYFSIMRLRSVCGDSRMMLHGDLFNSSSNTIHSEFTELYQVKKGHYILGEIECGLIPEKLVPLLMVGSLCHIGKGITQGYGGFFLS